MRLSPESGSISIHIFFGPISASGVDGKMDKIYTSEQRSSTLTTEVSSLTMFPPYPWTGSCTGMESVQAFPQNSSVCLGASHFSQCGYAEHFSIAEVPYRVCGVAKARKH